MGFCLRGDNSQADSADAATDAAAALKDTRTADEQRAKQERETKKVVTTVHPASQPGHTGYLTFATFPPSFAR